MSGSMRAQKILKSRGSENGHLRIFHNIFFNFLGLVCQLNRASDRVRKKITNYAEIFRNIMRKKVLIMRKTRWIMRKIFGSLRSPKITSFHAAEIEPPPKPRVCSQANFKQKQLYWDLGFSSYFHLYLVCYEIILSIM